MCLCLFGVISVSRGRRGGRCFLSRVSNRLRYGVVSSQAKRTPMITAQMMPTAASAQGRRTVEADRDPL
jgi:hypothetical protein